MASRAEIRNLGLFVKPGSDTVTHELANHAESVGFDILLHRSADISDCIADTDLLDSLIQRCLGDFEQFANFRLHRIVHRDGDCRVPIISVEHDTAIDRNDVAGFQSALIRRNAVNDLFVYRRAKYAWIIVVTLKSRLRAALFYFAFGSALEIHRGDAISDDGTKIIQDLADDVATAPHLFNFCRGFANDRHTSAGAVTLNLLKYPGGDLFHRPFAINRQQSAFALVIIGDRPGLLLVSKQTSPNYVLAIIIAGDELRTVHVAEFIDAWWLKMDVVNPSTDRAGPASGKPKQ